MTRVRSSIPRRSLLFLLLCAFSLPLLAADPAAVSRTEYTGRDTLAITPDDEKQAQKMLLSIGWTPAEFTVAVTPPVADPAQFPIAAQGFETDADALVTFPSPHPRENKSEPSNTVVLEWYKARFDAADRAPLRAPAVLVVHIMDPRLVVDRGIARNFAAHGINAFLMHLPDYGLRRAPGFRHTGAAFIERIRQSVADARRARDAIATLPRIDGRHVSIDGTSLGAFVAAGAASLDNAFDNAFLMLAGGDLYDMLNQGVREAAMVRELLEREGYTGEKLRVVADMADPAFLAHRLNPATTWLFSASSDQVVPPFSARALAAAAHLDAQHHFWISGDHYTSLLSLPWALQKVADAIHAAAVAPRPADP